MAKVILAKDWSQTALGPIETWPQSLRTTVSLVQASRSPFSLSWGAGHTQIYNDGYWPICGEKHPASMGQDFRECWAPAWDAIGEAYNAAWSGRSMYLEKIRMFLDRYGFLEETWFTFSFSPITDETGRIGGLFHPVTELTGQMLSERRTRTLRDLGIRSANARTETGALELAAEVLTEANLDISFAVLYLVEGNQARRVAHASIAEPGAEVVDLTANISAWEIARAFRDNAVVHLDKLELAAPLGPYPEPPQRAVVLPIVIPGMTEPAAIVVLGVSSRLMLTEAYQMFFELVAAAIGTALATARRLEQERRKAEALAEIDRAKTAFFSNVSHEFRTPLTLILGPIEDELAERPSPRLEAAYRNALRLLKLVNTLLDFSRIESNRIEAVYEPIDLAIETANLASVFRSAIERAGMTLTIDCAPLEEPVFVDRDMWEKIVLNLVSNALKHTFAGGITVALAQRDDMIELRVADTGIGIPALELPRVFDRFHRVKGAKSRSHEGTGIGLALVRELSTVLGGTVEVASAEGAGTVFTVTIKTGTAHLPADHLHARNVRSTGEIKTYIADADTWATPQPAPQRELGPKPRIVWADDNADMRAYVATLLGEEFEVIPVADGAMALQAVAVHHPDLVLSDVMMPNVDGFQLLAKLRADPLTHMLPVILLSARAGVEASSEGVDAGADDYLVKPFAARELVARVRTHVRLHRARQEWAIELERSNKDLMAFSYSVSHDLRAPLRAIHGFSQILLEDHAAATTPEVRNYLDKIQSRADRMSEIIDDLLALSRIGRNALVRENFDLGSVARDISMELRSREPTRIGEITVGDPLVVNGDRRLVALLLENLIGNAWKFTSTRKHTAITVGRNHNGFYVRDNGVGFDTNQAGHIFEPFTRLHDGAEFEGTGIGLAIVHRIVEQHAGRVWAESTPDIGTTIWFTLE